MAKTPEYITDEYQTKLNEVVAELDETSYPAAESVFLDEFESLQEDLGDDTPTGVIRRAALEHESSLPSHQAGVSVSCRRISGPTRVTELPQSRRQQGSSDNYALGNSSNSGECNPTVSSPFMSLSRIPDQVTPVIPNKAAGDSDEPITEGPQLVARMTTTDDGRTQCTLLPEAVPERQVTTRWITADEDAYIDLTSTD